MSEAVTVPSLTMMTSTASKESLARDTRHTQLAEKMLSGYSTTYIQKGKEHTLMIKV